MPRRKLCSAALAERLLASLIVGICLLVSHLPDAAAQQPSLRGTAGPVELRLEVWINNFPANIVTPFLQQEDGGFAALGSELDELGIVLPDGIAADTPVRLDSIDGLKYRYDAAAQAIHFDIPASGRRSKQYLATPARTRPEATPADYSALVNYSLFTSAQQSLSSRAATSALLGFNGANASLDARLIAPYGIFKQSGIVGNIPNVNLGGSVPYSTYSDLRLDSTFTRVDPESFLTYRAGDSISGSVAWSQPVRFGGLQVQRNFTARPDIVAQATPTFSGSAAAPSTVDVYVNSIRTYSQQVAAGPFELANVPTISAGGEARIVIRDASGREVETKQAFYSAPTLLKEGLFEVSAEAGFARYNYGIASDDYGKSPIGSATLRTGITDWLTGELHAEGGLGLANGGIGAVVNLGNMGVGAIAASGSVRNGDIAAQLYGSLDTKIGQVGVHAQSSRPIGNYQNLAAVTSLYQPLTLTDKLSMTNPVTLATLASNYDISVSRDQLTLSAPLEFDSSNVSASYLRSSSPGTPSTQMLTASYSRPFIERSTLFASIFADLSTIHNIGFYVGSSVPLGEASVTASVNKSVGGTTGSIDVSKPLGFEPGDWGYHVREAEGDQALRTAGVTYRADKARVEASVDQSAGAVRETATVSGSIVAMGEKVYLANTIDDGFAVVHTGEPGVRVLSENRLAGVTDEDGMVLVPNLRSNEVNNLTIDPTNLPLNAEVETPAQQAVPAFKSGIYVDLKVRRQAPSAVVIFKRPDGALVEVGSTGRLEGAESSFVVGYDGRAFIKNLAAANTAVVTTKGRECKATFAFEPQGDNQVMIGPVECQ